MKKEEKINIVFFLFDQFRADCLSITGNNYIKTPNMDDIGKNGAVFTSAYSSCPSCIAARASMFTGLSPSNHGRIGYLDCVPWNYKEMLPEVLGNSGYQTHCVGKTHFYPMRKHCGFHSLDSYEASHTFDPDYVNDYHEWVRDKTGGSLHEFDHGLTENTWNSRPSVLPEELHNNTWVVTKGIEFIKRRDKTRPFFLNLSFHRPHPPIDPPLDFWNMYKDAALPEVALGNWERDLEYPVPGLNAGHGQLDKQFLDQARRGYYAQIAHIDCQVGRMMRYLQYFAKVGPTAVIITADHGNLLGDHNLHRKGNALEGSAKIPLIIYHPDMDGSRYWNNPWASPEGQGKKIDKPVVSEDIYSTILSCAGISEVNSKDGLDLVPAVLGKGNSIARNFIHGEHAASPGASEKSFQGMQFLTDGKEKYIWYTRSGNEQFFNLKNDPGECEDLSDIPDYSNRIDAWRERMVSVLKKRPEDKLVKDNTLHSGKGLPPVREFLAKN